MLKFGGSGQLQHRKGEQLRWCRRQLPSPAASADTQCGCTRQAGSALGWGQPAQQSCLRRHNPLAMVTAHPGWLPHGFRPLIPPCPVPQPARGRQWLWLQWRAGCGACHCASEPAREPSWTGWAVAVVHTQISILHFAGWKLGGGMLVFFFLQSTKAPSVGKIGLWSSCK